MITSLLKGEQPKLTGCDQVRNYVYIDDAVEVLLKAGGDEVPFPLRMNFGTKNSVSLRDLVECISSELSMSTEIKFGSIPYRESEIMYLIPDLKVCDKFLHWTPEVPLSEGIKRTIIWYKKHIGQTRRLFEE